MKKIIKTSVNFDTAIFYDINYVVSKYGYSISTASDNYDFAIIPGKGHRYEMPKFFCTVNSVGTLDITTSFPTLTDVGTSTYSKTMEEWDYLSDMYEYLARFNAFED